jgi:hypothetical protein
VAVRQREHSSHSRVDDGAAASDLIRDLPSALVCISHPASNPDRKGAPGFALFGRIRILTATTALRVRIPSNN